MIDLTCNCKGLWRRDKESGEFLEQTANERAGEKVVRLFEIQQSFQDGHAKVGWHG